MDVKRLGEIEGRLRDGWVTVNVRDDVIALVKEVRAQAERIERLERVAEAARGFRDMIDREFREIPRSIYGEDYANIVVALAALDADDAPEPTPELVPVYPGPDLQRGDFVYTPGGRRAEVYNFLDDGVLTNLGTFCASVLRREKTDADEKGEE